MGLSSARTELYSAADLIDGFKPNDPIGYTATYDFRTFRQYIRNGGSTPSSVAVQLQQVEHDAHIANALRRFLASKPRLVGIMGGHQLARDQQQYALVARLARQLTREGFVTVSGGGPGAMEATHLGAFFATVRDQVLEDAIATLTKVPKLPKLGGILDANGDIVAGREGDLAAGHAWFKQAWEIVNTAKHKPGTSLAVPTWYYGHEPTCPFATGYAKYFQNSLREEALVTEARAGIIYARGGGGTVREIFQDAEQNFYANTADDFTPMIFFDSEQYWQREAKYDGNGAVIEPGIKVDDLLCQHLKFGRAGRPAEDFRVWSKKVCFTTDFHQIINVLSEHSPSALKNLELLLAAKPGQSSLAAWNRTTA
jgi:predicted Rossmann-fold nucleotide-binding protein